MEKELKKRITGEGGNWITFRYTWNNIINQLVPQNEIKENKIKYLQIPPVAPIWENSETWVRGKY